MPEMPEQETGATTLSVRDVSQELRERIPSGWGLRELRRSTRPRRLLNA